jgi:hypothetical protein
MNKIQFSFFAAGAALALAASALHAQTSIQRLSFSLIGEYQTNIYYTNADNSAGPLTNEDSLIRTVLVSTGNVIKALAVDLEGTNYSTWTGSELVREVNLTNGNEGIFLRKAGNQTNVSSFFGLSCSNNFTGELTNEFPALNTNLANVFTNTVMNTNGGFTNMFTNVFTNAFTFTNTVTNMVTNGGITYIFTNVFTNSFTTNSFSNNFSLETPLVHGWRRMTDPTNTTTNFVATAGLYFISLNTTNLKFNLLAVGDGAITSVAGHINGTLYERAINSQHLGSAGTFYLNIGTNIFDVATNPPTSFTGPMHGTVSTGQPSFSSTIAGP